MRPDKSEVLALESDPAMAAARLGWKAKTSLEEGLRLTAEWMQANLHHYRPEFLYA
jgi:nucleoside-diphosphate-sugar epimerase